MHTLYNFGSHKTQDSVARQRPWTMQHIKPYDSAIRYTHLEATRHTTELQESGYKYTTHKSQGDKTVRKPYSSGQRSSGQTP